MIMTKRIRVIQIGGEYVDRHEYSQGESSHTTTTDVLKAIDLNNDKCCSDFIWKCLERQGGIIEQYDITIEKVPSEVLCPYCNQPSSAHGILYGATLCPFNEPKGVVF